MGIKDFISGLVSTGEIHPEFEETEDYLIAKFDFEGDIEPVGAEVEFERNISGGKQVRRTLSIDDSFEEEEKMDHFVHLGLASEPQAKLARSVEEIDISNSDQVHKTESGHEVELEGRIEEYTYEVTVIPENEKVTPSSLEFTAWDHYIDHENREIIRDEEGVKVKFPIVNGDVESIEEEPDPDPEFLLEQNEKVFAE